MSLETAVAVRAKLCSIARMANDVLAVWAAQSQTLFVAHTPVPDPLAMRNVGSLP